MQAMPHTLPPDLLDQGRGGGRGAPGGQDVVDDQDALARLDAVAVQLDRGGAVLELVLLGDRLGRELALLADRHEAGAEVVGDRRGRG